nr:MAG TPA_asm: hypothetical protein [Caudoviricetes sp.]
MLPGYQPMLAEAVSGSEYIRQPRLANVNCLGCPSTEGLFFI